MFQDLIATVRAPRYWIALLYGLLGVGFLGIALVDPAGSRFYPKCLFHAWTGWHCPGCGGLRALHQGLRGHFGAALRLNPLMVLFLPVLGYGVLSDMAFVARGRGLPRVAVRPVWCWVLLGVMLVFWIARNLPVYPFTLLAP
jgi:hypothetical protein